MRRLRRLFREEQGFALVIALGVTVVFGLMVVTVIESARSNSRIGTIYLDGSAKVDIGSVVRYKGQATIYTSGTVLVKNTQLCGYSAGASCTFANWDSTKDLLGFVANGNGSLPADNQVPSGDGVQFVSSYFQGAVYATNIIDIGTTATVDGPLDGSTVILGQSSTSTFNGYTFVPVGMPGNPTIFALAQTPQVTGG
jgi:Tfp pilus assembly protein PilX